MPSSGDKPNRAQGLFKVLVLVLAAAAVVASQSSFVQAQTGGIDTDPGDRGTGGRNTIEGRILIRGGRLLERRAKVQLRRLNNGDLFLLSDDNGAFTFRRLRGGTYTVIVDAGNEFEKASQSVDIIEPARRRDDPGITVQVTIFVEAKGSTSPSRPSGTIDATAGAVPDAARDLYKQALESSKSGDRNKAIDLFKQALAVSTNFMSALTEPACQYISLQDRDNAAEAMTHP